VAAPVAEGGEQALAWVAARAAAEGLGWVDPEAAVQQAPATEGEEQPRALAVAEEWVVVRASGAQEPGREELAEGAVKNLGNG